MGGIIATILGGPIMGLLGSVVSAFTKEREHKMNLEDKRADQAHELALLSKHAAQRGAELENDRAIAEADAVSRSVVASFQHDAASAGHSYPWVDAIKTLFRPAITLLLVALAGAIYFTFDAATTINALQEHIVYSILFLGEVAVTWWFADRARNSIRNR